MTAVRRLAPALLASTAALATGARPARAEALSTTSLGLGIRSITYTPAKTGDQQIVDAAEGSEGAKTESINDAVICQRVSTPSSLGLELGAGGCVQGGGFWTFTQSTSAHVQLIYYPLASRTRVTDDAAVRLNREFFGDLYLVGQGGFAKVTHNQTDATNLTLSMDLIEFGGGIGWSYRLSRNVATGVEGFYLVGSTLSKAASGSSSVILALGSLTVFL